MRAAGKYAKNGGEFGGIAEIEKIKTFESIIFYSVSREILATRLFAPICDRQGVKGKLNQLRIPDNASEKCKNIILGINATHVHKYIHPYKYVSTNSETHI